MISQIFDVVLFSVFSVAIAELKNDTEMRKVHRVITAASRDTEILTQTECFVIARYLNYINVPKIREIKLQYSRLVRSIAMATRPLHIFDGCLVTCWMCSRLSSISCERIFWWTSVQQTRTAHTGSGMEDFISELKWKFKRMRSVLEGNAVLTQNSVFPWKTPPWISPLDLLPLLGTDIEIITPSLE